MSAFLITLIILMCLFPFSQSEKWKSIAGWKRITMVLVLALATFVIMRFVLEVMFVRYLHD